MELTRLGSGRIGSLATSKEKKQTYTVCHLLVVKNKKNGKGVFSRVYQVLYTV